MRSYEAAAAIQASPDRVWAVLTDIANWPSWDSGVTNVVGALAVAEQYTGPLAGMIFKSIPDLSPSFTQFAAGLRKQAEK
jgi:hypothetical protein